LNIGDNIKKYRKLRGLTQIDLSKLIEKSVSTIQKYESNSVKPDINTIKNIAQKLDTSMSSIIGDDDELEFQAHIEGYADNVDEFYKCPSDVKIEKAFDNISKSIDLLLSDRNLEEEINYKYDEFDIYEKNEINSFIFHIIELKINEIKFRKKINK
jgi:transcriptional regulator with XRE-family HTH domain